MNARVLQGKQAVMWFRYQDLGQYQDLLLPTMSGAEFPVHSQIASTFPSAAPAQIKLPLLSKTKRASQAGAWQVLVGE